MPNVTSTTRFGNLADRTGNVTNNIDVDYKIEYEPGFIDNAIGQAVGHATAWVKGKINSAIMSGKSGRFRDEIAPNRDTISSS